MRVFFYIRKGNPGKEKEIIRHETVNFREWKEEELEFS